MKNVLFLQLPQLDNDVRGRHENVPLAALYLEHALEQSSEGRYWSGRHISKQADALDDHGLLRIITRIRPDVISATLYLWNIERTLHLLAQARAALPRVRIVAGGPEVAPDHPFLFKSHIADIAVYGEGEPVFPHILRALRTGRRTNFINVAWRRSRAYSWGAKPPPAFNLPTDLPPPRHRSWRPDAHGMAYLETTRGCPLRCAFCCYGHRRSRITALPADEVIERVRILRARGAREIRFIDPTFNAHPEFDAIISGLARLNRNRRLEFFCELRAETLSALQARLLAAGNFREIEVGMQSRNPQTLRTIRRPTHLANLDHGITRLTRAGVRVTVDLMYGLPAQNLADIRAMIRWSAKQRRINVQCLQTLLLPGTDLRARRNELALVAADEPPYAVASTAALRAEDIRAAEQLARRTLRMQMDCPTQRFVGRQLPDLFPEQVVVEINALDAARRSLALHSSEPGKKRWRASVPRAGAANRRALVIRGARLFERREEIARLIREAVTLEPYILWQFVLEPEREEPLDLLDYLSDTIRQAGTHVVDRFLDMHSPGKRASRRLMVRLRPGHRYARDWSAAAEAGLRDCFF